MDNILAEAPVVDIKSIVVLVMVMIAVIALMVTVFTCLFLIARNGNNMKLKKAMIDKGMSAGEIERVLAAKSQI